MDFLEEKSKEILVRIEEAKTNIVSIIDEEKREEAETYLDELQHYYDGIQYQIKDENREAANEYMQVNYQIDDDFPRLFAWATRAYGMGSSVEFALEHSDELYGIAAGIDPDNDSIYYEWGTLLAHLAELKNDEEFFIRSFEKFGKAIQLFPQHFTAYAAWAKALGELARLKKDEELFELCFKKFNNALGLNPDSNSLYEWWGIALVDLGDLTNDEKYYKEAITKHKMATVIDPKSYTAFYNWGMALVKLAQLKDDKRLFEESIDLFKQYIKRGGKLYTVARACAGYGDKETAFDFLDKTLADNRFWLCFVYEEECWKQFWEDKDFKRILDKYDEGFAKEREELKRKLK